MLCSREKIAQQGKAKRLALNMPSSTFGITHITLEKRNIVEPRYSHDFGKITNGVREENRPIEAPMNPFAMKCL